MTLILIRFGEMALKSPRVRRLFARILVHDLQRRFLRAGLECIVQEEWGRIFVETTDYGRARAVLSSTFGVVSFSEVFEVATDKGMVAEEAISLLSGTLGPGSTFGVRCRRSGTHDFTSQELAAYVGETVLAAFPELGLKVDLKTPQVRMDIEVRGRSTYLFLGRDEGPGGMPLGSQGGVGGILEERDLLDQERLLVSYYLVMKRGCKVFPICIYKQGAHAAEEADLLDSLRALDPDVRMRHAGPETSSDGWSQQMFEQQEGFPALVSSRTLADGLFDMKGPVFYPLIALSEEQVAGYLSRLPRKRTSFRPPVQKLI